MIRSVAYVCVASSLGALAALAQQHAPAPRGQKEFAQSCGFCHGDDATGSRGPDLVRSPLVNKDSGGDLIAPVIRNGRPDQGMPAQPLPDNTIQDIVVFLHLRVQQAAKSSNVGGDYPLERLLTGNADAGRAYFNGDGKCASCHSPTGDLAGIAKKYAPLFLEERMLAPHPRGRTPVIVTTSSGEQVSGQLDHLDDFSVSLRDAGGWYRSWPRDKVTVSVQDPLQAHRDMLTKYTDADIHNLFAYLETLQ
ncbi:MAG TPA: c-type cytochrome [Bryobacteraceae bacterium]|jgi:cytochrome c oxidase cbb3-type subunit 3|nr:c-type cytochrome [Bryobacteraceae bacterium]